MAKAKKISTRPRPKSVERRAADRERVAAAFVAFADATKALIGDPATIELFKDPDQERARLDGIDVAWFLLGAFGGGRVDSHSAAVLRRWALSLRMARLDASGAIDVPKDEAAFRAKLLVDDNARAAGTSFAMAKVLLAGLASLLDPRLRSLEAAEVRRVMGWCAVWVPDGESRRGRLESIGILSRICHEFRVFGHPGKGRELEQTQKAISRNVVRGAKLQ